MKQIIAILSLLLLFAPAGNTYPTCSGATCWVDDYRDCATYTETFFEPGITPSYYLQVRHNIGPGDSRTCNFGSGTLGAPPPYTDSELITGSASGYEPDPLGASMMSEMKSTTGYSGSWTETSDFSGSGTQSDYFTFSTTQNFGNCETAWIQPWCYMDYNSFSDTWALIGSWNGTLDCGTDSPGCDVTSGTGYASHLESGIQYDQGVADCSDDPPCGG